MQIKLCELNYANFTMLNKKVTDSYKRLLIFVKKIIFILSGRKYLKKYCKLHMIFKIIYVKEEVYFLNSVKLQ